MRWWDIDSVRAIEEAEFPHDPWTAGQFWSELAHVPETRWYVVAEDEGVIIGYAGLFCLPPDADVQTIAVASNAAGRGVGRALLRALEGAARMRGASRLTLEVAADNARARDLYARNGFEQIAVRPRYYGDKDAIIMQKRLADARVAEEA